jgi:hypothetical protein
VPLLKVLPQRHCTPPTERCEGRTQFWTSQTAALPQWERRPSARWWRQCRATLPVSPWQ